MKPRPPANPPAASPLRGLTRDQRYAASLLYERVGRIRHGSLGLILQCTGLMAPVKVVDAWFLLLRREIARVEIFLV